MVRNLLAGMSQLTRSFIWLLSRRVLKSESERWQLIPVLKCLMLRAELTSSRAYLAGHSLTRARLVNSSRSSISSFSPGGAGKYRDSSDTSAALS